MGTVSLEDPWTPPKSLSDEVAAAPPAGKAAVTIAAPLAPPRSLSVVVAAAAHAVWVARIDTVTNLVPLTPLASFSDTTAVAGTTDTYPDMGDGRTMPEILSPTSTASSTPHETFSYTVEMTNDAGECLPRDENVLRHRKTVTHKEFDAERESAESKMQRLLGSHEKESGHSGKKKRTLLTTK